MRNLDEFSGEGSFGEKEKIEEKIKKISLEQEKKQEMEEKKKEIIDKCEELASFVRERYENSVIAQNRKQLEVFNAHNRQIVDLSVGKGLERGLSQKDVETLAVAASLHDLGKGDPPPEWAEDIPNFMVVYHGEKGVLEIEQNEELQNLIKKILGEEDFSERIAQIQEAIRTHMGPGTDADDPKKLGFMAKILEDVNSKLETKGIEKISHPLPKENDQISKILLASDMYSLADAGGVKKVLEIRSAVKFFAEQDRQLCDEYEKYGIKLSVGEAALISALESGGSARNMFKDKQDRKWIEEAIKKAEARDYEYTNESGEIEKVSPIIVKEKLEAFNEAVEQESVRNKIKKAA